MLVRSTSHANPTPAESPTNVDPATNSAVLASRLYVVGLRYASAYFSSVNVPPASPGPAVRMLNQNITRSGMTVRYSTSAVTAPSTMTRPSGRGQEDGNARPRRAPVDSISCLALWTGHLGRQGTLPQPSPCAGKGPV